MNSGLREWDQKTQCKVRGLREMRLLHLQLRREEAEVELEVGDNDDDSPNTGRKHKDMHAEDVSRIWRKIMLSILHVDELL